MLLVVLRRAEEMSCFRVPAVPAIDSDGRNVACANCGKHGSDTVKLKDCAACRLVKYCGVDCQRAHRKQHKRACGRNEACASCGKEYALAGGPEWRRWWRGGVCCDALAVRRVCAVLKV